MLQPAFLLQSPESLQALPTLFFISTQSATVLARATYYAHRHGSQLKSFLPYVLPSCHAPIILHATLFICTRGTLAARPHHTLLRCAAIVLWRRPRWPLKAKMYIALYDFDQPEVCFVQQTDLSSSS